MAKEDMEISNPFNSINLSESVGEGTQVIEDFLTGTATTDPKDITKIEEEKPDTTKKDKPVKTAEKIAAEAKAKEEAEKLRKKNLTEFLGDEDEGKEDEEEIVEETTNKSKKPVVPGKKEEKEEEVVNEEDEPSSDNTFINLSKELFTQGVFEQEEGEDEASIDTPEKFLERFNYEKMKGANQKIEAFLSQFGEDYKNAFQAIYVNGVDPKEYFTKYNEIADLANLDMKSESNQELVVKQGLKEQGFEGEEITAEFEKIKNYGDLEERANRFHKVLLKNQTAKLSEVEETKKSQLKNQQAMKEQYVKNVFNTLQDKVKNKEFDGIPINPKLAQELQDYLVTDKWRTTSGEALTDFDKAILDLKKPENHQLKVKVALILKTLEKDPTLSTIQKRAVSKETNQMFSNLIVKKEKSSVKGQKSNAFSNL